MTDKPLSIRLPEPLKVEEIDAVAQRRGMSRAGFVISAVKFFMELDDVFLARMENYAKRLNIPLSLVMQNMLIKRLAKEAAEYEVLGPSPQLLEEFMFTNQGVITGGELFDMLKKSYLRDIENEGKNFTPDPNVQERIRRDMEKAPSFADWNCDAEELIKQEQELQRQRNAKKDPESK